MKYETKKDFKDTFDTIVIVLLSAVLVTVINKQCSGLMQKATGTKIEKIQKVKNKTIETQKVR